ncbi:MULTISPECIES: isoprenyl transferase [unclassified Staphylococcus]|uniref:isoprenyl transferase n=1 Tax=unclassified Staphylococcus TaxID=91994 RepID=UPI0021D3515E|nr:MULTISPECIES: isoprenyl transferase [unclassified Staphylococcus]UXR77516.1 isoprenyl transferase [Staphylococcus sp. IVB6227]UXR83342.1 isoprenyl transferase [Staphylococcus sp. IVB6214]
MFKKFRKNDNNQPQCDTLDLQHIPEHIAIIMDGNGRWAKQRKMPRIKGHFQGMETIKTITREASTLGVKYLTLYAFSTENWSRPQEEINYIMGLPVNFLNTFLPELIEKNVKVETIGFVDELPTKTIQAIEEAKLKTADNTGLTLIFAINYGGRAEIMHGIQNAINHFKHASESEIAQLTEKDFSRFLMTADFPDPDLLIRTSGEQRISNFLIWQLSYSEFIFNEKMWPEFDAEDLQACIKTYQSRQRRFGGL